MALSPAYLQEGNEEEVLQTERPVETGLILELGDAAAALGVANGAPGLRVRAVQGMFHVPKNRSPISLVDLMLVGMIA